ncbi:ImmA/IrrE family metallo-endopeptidase [Priestia filamentosa]|uniref:ImmA/IrrE family metallo-endopeptidase n=1 Tax=Priestia filamentosa TaxID=1402861 RepID=UPI0039828865
MDYQYVPTHLEEWISNEYIKRNIITPKDLTIEHIADCFQVDLVIRSGKVFSANVEGQLVIFLRNEDDLQKQKEKFFHELCHALIHSGRQTNMPLLLRELQENQAENFVKYASLPYHMLSYIKEDDVYYTSELFDISIKVCRDRMLSLQGRKPYKRGQIFRHLVPALSSC